jgi:hypothetical protein
VPINQQVTFKKLYSATGKSEQLFQQYTQTGNSSDLFETISRARTMTENHAYKSTSYIRKTLFNYWEK